jgi:hypothetical protein
MSHVVRLGQAGLTLAVACIVLASPAQLRAQAVHPLAQRLANQLAATEENTFLLQMERVTPAAHKERATALVLEGREITTQIRLLPRDVQVQIQQQANSLLQVRMVPIREQWKQQYAEKVKTDQARDAQRRAELLADAEAAGKVQATRTLIRERLQRNEISQAEAARADQAAEQQVMALQRKYDAYGISSRVNWGVLFQQSVARYAATSVTDLRLRERLDDTQSEIGRDAHRAAELNLAMQRNAIFLAQRAVTAPEAQTLNEAAQKELSAIQGKYGPTVASTADFTDRYTRLVQAGAAAQRQTWEREALVARDAAAARLVAQREAAVEQARAAAAAGAAARAAQVPQTTAAPPVNVPSARRQTAQQPSSIPGPTAPPPQRGFAARGRCRGGRSSSCCSWAEGARGTTCTEASAAPPRRDSPT